MDIQALFMMIGVVALAVICFYLKGMIVVLQEIRDQLRINNSRTRENQ